MSSRLRVFLFPAALLASVAAALIWPRAFDAWWGLDLRVLIVPLLQVITFGMGTTLGREDFARVLKVPWPVMIGALLQFTVMPLVGYSLAIGLGFEPEVAAGIILVGSVSGGVASNLVTYLAGGDVALSVTMTAVSTLASPFVTPLLMQLLAGRLVPLDAVAMMFDIINMILVPILAGLVAHPILYGSGARRVSVGTLVAYAVAGVAAAAATLGSARWVEWPPLLAAIRSGLVLGAVLLAVVAAVKLVMERGLGRLDNWMDTALTVVSMVGICLILAIICARSREKLLTVGPLLLVAVMAHNGVGFILGYWGARLARLDERTCRTVAIEVGMQNSGMASGLAMTVLKSSGAALAPAIFGPVMNLSGALLAGWWKSRPPHPAHAAAATPSPAPGPSAERGRL